MEDQIDELRAKQQILSTIPTWNKSIPVTQKLYVVDITSEKEEIPVEIDHFDYFDY